MDNSTLDLTPYFDSVFGTGYNTMQFDPTDPRNVAPGSNSVDVHEQISTGDKVTKFLRDNKTGLYWAAAGLVALAVMKGGRR